VSGGETFQHQKVQMEAFLNCATCIVRTKNWSNFKTGQITKLVIKRAPTPREPPSKTNLSMGPPKNQQDQQEHPAPSGKICEITS